MHCIYNRAARKLTRAKNTASCWRECTVKTVLRIGNIEQPVVLVSKISRIV